MTSLYNVYIATRHALKRWHCCVYQAHLGYSKASFHSDEGKKSTNYKINSKVIVVGGSVIAVLGLYYYAKDIEPYLSAATAQQSNPLLSNVGVFKDNLPTYSLEEVSFHSDIKQGIWVTYRQGVYDITNFIEKHPGGSEKIVMAAGGSVEPFWLLYGIHKSPQVLSILEEHRIGNLSEEEASTAIVDLEDPYVNEPRRHPSLKPSSIKPFNAEPPVSLLGESFITPNDLFYVRNHLPVPEVDEKTYELEISGLGVNNITLKLNDIKYKFPKYTIIAAIQCAGNRRSEMTSVKPVKGLSWGQAAIGNASWSGAKLSDILKYAGFDGNNTQAEHIQFEGLDTDSANVPYGASIPIEKALDPNGDVLLAFEMNGEPLSRDHGFPIRVIVPGVVGARNVKWLGRIVVSKLESDSHWQQGDYKGFSPSVDWHNVDFSTSPAIQELPVVSAICEPLEGSSVKLKDDKIIVRGYAWSGGGRKIIRVDITADEGKTWHVANFTGQTKDKVPRHWGWTLWEVEIPIAKSKKKIQLWAKAVDSSYNVQPERFENIWNLRGVLSNAYHRVNINIEK